MAQEAAKARALAMQRELEQPAVALAPEVASAQSGAFAASMPKRPAAPPLPAGPPPRAASSQPAPSQPPVLVIKAPPPAVARGQALAEQFGIAIDEAMALPSVSQRCAAFDVSAASASSQPAPSPLQPMPLSQVITTTTVISADATPPLGAASSSSAPSQMPAPPLLQPTTPHDEDVAAAASQGQRQAASGRVADQWRGRPEPRNPPTAAGTSAMLAQGIALAGLAPIDAATRERLAALAGVVHERREAYLVAIRDWQDCAREF